MDNTNINVATTCAGVMSPTANYTFSQNIEKPTNPTQLYDDNDSNADETESLDSNSSKKELSPRTPRNSSRSVTMQTLLQEGVLEAGPSVLSIDYLGQKFSGDLLPNGKIQWENTQFASPSSWATYIKKKINPSKKSGSGWNSVKYKGKKLDKLKSNWFRKNNPNLSSGHSPASNLEEEILSQNSAVDKSIKERRIVKVADLKQINNLNMNTMVECERFDETIGNPQPIAVMISASVLLLVDFHCHLMPCEVVGYLGGKWDLNKKCLYIMQAFPCRCKQCDQEAAVSVEQQINSAMMMRGLQRVGWYHSHPITQPEPTLRDIEVQNELQLITSATHPTIGLICSPYDLSDKSRTESSFNAFFTVPPPEGVHELQCYVIPMKLSYTEASDQIIQQDILNAMKQLIDYYKLQPDSIRFSKIWNGTMTYLDKLKLSLQRKLPKEKKDGQLIQYLHDLITSLHPAS